MRNILIGLGVGAAVFLGVKKMNESKKDLIYMQSPLYAKYKDMFAMAAKKHSVPLVFLESLAWCESNFNEKAVSPRGAQGIMQFMPKTAVEYNIDAWNPSQAINAGALYLSRAANELFGGDWMWAAAAYNMGRTGALRVKNKVINTQTNKPYTMPTETTRYVAKIGKISGMW